LVYGATGPTSSNYTVSLDGFASTLQVRNDTGRTVLYEAPSLRPGRHTLEIVNGGSGLLLDLFVIGLELGGPW
jgi:hypothetical protein